MQENNASARGASARVNSARVNSARVNSARINSARPQSSIKKNDDNSIVERCEDERDRRDDGDQTDEAYSKWGLTYALQFLDAVLKAKISILSTVFKPETSY